MEPTEEKLLLAKQREIIRKEVDRLDVAWYPDVEEVVRKYVDRTIDLYDER